jgi:hypothetical protein
VKVGLCTTRLCVEVEKKVEGSVFGEKTDNLGSLNHNLRAARGGRYNSLQILVRVETNEQGASKLLPRPALTPDCTLSHVSQSCHKSHTQDSARTQEPGGIKPTRMHTKNSDTKLDPMAWWRRGRTGYTSAIHCDGQHPHLSSNTG